MPEPYVFLSHSSQDNPITQRLADDLEDAGFTVWVDFEEIGDGERWVKRIQDGVDHCSALVVVMSRAARQSEWVERETVLALRLRKPLFIARVQDVPLPLQLITRQFTDFVTDYGAGLQSLVKALRKALQTPPPDADPKTLPPSQSPDPNESNFFAYIAQMEEGAVLALFARDLYNWGKQHADEVIFSGKYRPAYHVRVNVGNKSVTVFSVLAYMQNPSLQIPLDYLGKYPPFTDANRRLQTLAALNQIMPQDEQFADARANRRPTLPISTALDTAESMESFQAIAQGIIEALRAGVPA